MTIAEVSRVYELTPDTLRYYERVGLLPNVERKNGIRNYSEDDCKWVEFIKCMRGAGMPIDVLIEYVNLFKVGDSTIKARKELLIQQRTILLEKMQDMQKTIDRLDFKIERYSQTVLNAEKELS